MLSANVPGVTHEVPPKRSPGSSRALFITDTHHSSSQKYFLRLPAAKKIRKTARFNTTMLAPTGISREYERTIPIKKHIVETMPEQITTPLKLE